ncbi:MAG: FAD-dependent oxidoreductase [Spirochaetales bacterium]|nr:FAD-dependent oxidoreductase [Spirochaetales bacterium]MCF7939424.1 FAD-dependent oxidoreductase [Spirochaetales bacterium]
MKKWSILRPFDSLKFIGQKPVTIRVPFESKPTAERYRGFHINDLEKCIGCGTCAEICDNDAIRMVPMAGVEKETGKSDKRPAIDYGRCCWCGLCVDICTTNSLGMTQEYIHIDPDVNTFYILPDMEGIHKTEYPQGYTADEEVNFLDLERVPMKELQAEERKDSFIEIVKGFSKEEAQKEASRCVACGLCTDTCPAHMNIPEYIDAVWRDDIEEAGRQIYKNNPLPDVCGRICTHNCETACSIGNRGEPISIRWLKRYAMDAIPVGDYRSLVDQKVVKPLGKNIAVVGGGSSGLSAGYYLALMGYGVTIYEAYPEAGGMMRYGIPEYRLPYDVLDKDIRFIEELGVTIKTGTRVGEDVSLDRLHEENDAVLIATGFHEGRSTRTPGTDHENVYQAVDLLAKITMGEEIRVDEKIVVIGGGNVAMDIARSLGRKQMQKYGKLDVTVTSLESRDIMPADEEEILESQEEGLAFYPGRGPSEVRTADGKVTGLKTVKCTRVFDENGRFSPQFDESDVMVLEGSMVIEAIGQAPDMAYLGEFSEQLEYDGRRLKVDEYFQTSLEWLFVSGDIIKGPDVINGIATGHQAAFGIDRYLQKAAQDELETIDQVMELVVDFEERSTSYVEKALSSGSCGTDTGCRRMLARFLERKKGFAGRIRDALSERNLRIHLRQELGREQHRYFDFALLDNLPEAAELPDKAAELPESAEGTRQKGISEHLSAGYRLYNDLLRLTANKELEFLFESLRDEYHEQLRIMQDLLGI